MCVRLAPQPHTSLIPVESLLSFNTRLSTTLSHPRIPNTTLRVRYLLPPSTSSPFRASRRPETPFLFDSLVAFFVFHLT